MISRCGSCGAIHVHRATAECPGCGAPLRAGDRLCALAHEVGEEVACPPGGCALLRTLHPGGADALGDPCPVEALAGAGPGAALTRRTLDELRRRLEGPAPVRGWGAEHARHLRHQEALARWQPLDRR